MSKNFSQKSIKHVLLIVDFIFLLTKTHKAAVVCILTKCSHVGFEINMLFNPKSPQHNDWSSACMSRDRFKFLCCRITFDNIDTRIIRAINDRKFYKMNEIFDHFKLNLKKCIEPGSRVCIDEQLYAYRGRCPFKQYIPSKPAKYGIKYWSLVDVQSGVLIDTNIYLGIFKYSILILFSTTGTQP